MINFNELVLVKVRKIKEDTIIHYPEIEDLCYRPYPNHQKGCPNISKCDHLNIPDFETILEYGDFYYFYLIYAQFNFKQYKELRKKEHPNWTNNQIKCVLYWQGSVKKILSDAINNLPLKKEDYVLGCGSGMNIKARYRIGSMENSWINVFSTCKLNGIKLEVRPKEVIHLVCLLCTRNKIKKQKQLSIKNYCG